MFNIPLPNTKDNHYTTLGILQTASHDEIKKVYRKLSLEYHPDRNSGDKNKAEIYVKINEAYRVLSDDIERKQYDMMLAVGSFSSISSNVDPSQLMSMFFSKADTQNIINEFANIPFSSLLGFGQGQCSNLFKNMNLNKFNNPNQQNYNQQNYNQHNPNQHNPNQSHNISKGFSQYEYDSKPAIISHTINLNLQEAYTGCKIPISITRWIIDNDRKSEQTETIYIDVPKGIDNNEIITILNKGNRISDTNRGNIEINVSINKHEIFDRNGIDLIFKKSITLKESFCGFSFDLNYIDGRIFKINNEIGNIIPVGFQKIIPKMGMRRDDDIGNLIILFDIVYPNEFTASQIEELSKIL